MSTPKVSIVLPVYNGENFLRVAIESVLAQTFTDYELIIMDNASTDSTPVICKEYADRDPRIRYHRHPKNLGASQNHILGFAKAVGLYVKYLAHDDAWEPTLLAKAVQVLDEKPEVILAYPKTRLIDEQGETIEDFDPKLDFNSPIASKRIRACVWGRHRAYPIFGLVRASAMRRTKGLQPFVDSDRIWLARLVLQGPFYEISEFLFYSRMHNSRYGSFSNRPAVQLSWFDPNRVQTRVYPAARLYREYLWAVMEADLPPTEKLACLWVTATCFREAWWRGKLKDDLVRLSSAVTSIF